MYLRCIKILLLALMLCHRDGYTKTICGVDYFGGVIQNETYSRSEIVAKMTQSVPDSKSARSIQFVTYFTDDIRSYSYLAYAINSLYANYRHYFEQQYTYRSSVFRYVPESDNKTGQIVEKEWDTNDVRWNKVIIMYNLLSDLLSAGNKRSHNDSAKLSSNYLIWLDSDLIIANFSFSFSRLISEHGNEVDIFVSREINPDNGIANTGCMIMKISSWSQSFLWRWWTAWDRREGMDQHVFDAIYKQLTPEERHLHIRLLDVAAINSKFPGLVSHHVHNPVLHLAGESNFVRYHIFKLSWESLCSFMETVEFEPDVSLIKTNFTSLDDNQLVYPPFGISRRVLDEVDYIGLHKWEWNSIEDDLAYYNTIIISIAADFELVLDALLKTRYRIREAQQSLAKFVCYYLNHSAQVIDSDISNLKLSVRYKQTIHSDFSNDMTLNHDQNCHQMKEIFYSNVARALSGVYHMYHRLQNQLDLEKFSIPIVLRLQLAQSILDASMELLTVLHFDDASYKEVIITALALLHRLQSSSPSANDAKVLLYYEYKLLEYRALYLENEYVKPLRSIDNIAEIGIEEIIDAWQATWNVWNKMVYEYHFFGTGNAVAHAFDEGIALALRLASFYCGNIQKIEESPPKQSQFIPNVQLGQSYLQWISEIMAGRNSVEAETSSKEWKHLSVFCAKTLEKPSISNKNGVEIAKKKKFRKKHRR